MCDKKPEIEIRRAKLQDTEAVMNILKNTEFFRPVELDIAEEVFDEAVCAGPESDYQSYVAVDINKVIGWVCFGETPCTEGTYDIYWIAVDPEYQNHGIGKALMEYSTRIIKGSKGRMIAIDTSGNQRYYSTRRFYENLGYEMGGCIKDFYADGDDKIIYLKRL